MLRATLFHKTREDNWPVAWHQDRAIAVREPREAPGFRGWSMKAGVVHVQPPAAILEGMLALRLHLDPCDEENDALRVIPGSHRRGILSDEEADRLASEGPVIHCAVPAGGVLLMRPLLLHASSPTRSPGHRRVIHFEYAAQELPAGLQWATTRPAPGFLL